MLEGTSGPFLRDPGLDPVEHLVDLDVRDRPPGQRLADARLELVAVPGLARAVALDHHQADVLDALVGREPAVAGLAVAAPPDRAAVAGRAGIDHPVVVDTTPWTAHRQEPQDVVAARTLAATRRRVNRRARTSDLPGHEPAGVDRGRSPARSRRSWRAGRRRARPAAAIDHSVSPACTTTTCWAGGAGASARRTARPRPAGSSSTATRAVPTIATVRRRRTYVRCMTRMVVERVFDVKRRVEHMFALPLARC